MEIDEIRQIAKAADDGWVARFEDALADYYSQNGEAAVYPLLTLFGSYLPDEVNFSIIHCAEQASPSGYIDGIVRFLESEDDYQSEWIDIIHFRLFNGPVYFAHYIKAVRSGSAVLKDRVISYVSRLRADPRNEKFEARLEALHQAAS